MNAFRQGKILLALAAVALVAGCQTSTPRSASFASVVIKDKSSAEISVTTVAVFTADGYHALASAGNELLFEKEGTSGDEIAYGSWLGDGHVMKRVRARVVSTAPGQHRLECEAFIVRHAEDPMFREEIRLKSIRARPYQKLLDEVASRLKAN